jgi:hypothetical protein
MQAKQRGKKFDAVKMMRVIRDTLSKKYINHPELEDSDLAKVSRKYGIRPVREPSQNNQETNKGEI